MSGESMIFDETNIKRIDIDRAFKAGAQSRQAEIDELQKRIDDLININESLVDYKNQLLDDIEGKENETRFD